MISPQFEFGLHDEIVVDNFAGGGGASTGIEQAIGRPVDHALNHDPKALAMHRVNHPQTVHHLEDIRKADPVAIANGRPVGLCWFSPDCKHFSKAKGGKPREKGIRGLAWVAVNWVNKVAPRVIILENVEEFQTWGPLAPDGQPKKARSGWFFRCFKGALSRRGYVVEHKELRACDYGAPTIRKRFFLVARRDGQPIVWPTPTHGDKLRQNPRAVAECIDWSLPCPSIFLTRADARALGVKRPLAPATQKRVARGVQKFVMGAARPFIVSLTHQGGDRVESVDEPAKTITAAHNGEKALVHVQAACMTYAQQGGSVRSAAEPINTITASRKDQNQLVACSLATLRSGMDGQSPERPVSAMTASGGHHAAVACHLARYNTGAVGCDPQKPINTIACRVSKKGGGGNGFAVVACAIATNTTGHAPSAVDSPLPTLATGGHQMLVSASLVAYYGSEADGQGVGTPARTMTTKDRFALAQTSLDVEPLTPEKAEKARAVAAWLRAQGVEVPGEFALVAGLVIWDIGLRMLKPRECYNAQGFPPSYIIDRGLSCDEPHHEFRLTAAEQMRMCGNSVCPPLARALVEANYFCARKERVAA